MSKAERLAAEDRGELSADDADETEGEWVSLGTGGESGREGDGDKFSNSFGLFWATLWDKAW